MPFPGSSRVRSMGSGTRHTTGAFDMENSRRKNASSVSVQHHAHNLSRGAAVRVLEVTTCFILGMTLVVVLVPAWVLDPRSLRKKRFVAGKCGAMEQMCLRTLVSMLVEHLQMCDASPPRGKDVTQMNLVSQSTTVTF
ncbi:unnamed protein product [Hydatigera taeniaeformis]|uniref:Transmembrane protein n=1 Tax=Hydatigena taeniaeformis TaxID=6205 RepID=A0A0R3WI35_HYDTA|nr:unnamed protein product [Hydatigera taeniaeformis]